MTVESSWINNPNFLADLENAIREGQCILLIGCGLAGQIQIGSRNPPPTWRKSLYKIVKWCADNELIGEPDEEEAILTLIDEGQLSAAGKKLADDYLSNKLLLWECLNQILLHESILHQSTFSRLHDLVVQIPFRAYFATTYDTFLEKVFLSHHKHPLARYDEGSIADAVKANRAYLENEQPFMLKLHGDVKKPDSLLLGDRDFKRLREDVHSPYRSGLKRLLMASSVLCIGFEETDHDLAYLLAEAGIESKPHIDMYNKYWSLVVQTEQSEGGEDSLDKRIKIIPCRKEEVVVFFERLLANLQPHSDQEVSVEPQRGGSGTNGEGRNNLQPEQAPFSQEDSSPNATKIYVSYHQKDADLWKELNNHLEGMNEWIEVQDRNKVGPGKDERTEISALISKADIMLLLVSPDFVADKDSTTYEKGSITCDYEVTEAMKRQPQLRVIPIILRPVYWKDEPYKGLRSLPRGDKSVHEAKDKDQTFKSIAVAIREIVDELRQLQKSQ